MQKFAGKKNSETGELGWNIRLQTTQGNVLYP